MATHGADIILRHLHRLATPTHSSYPDPELLRRFSSDHDETAFATLVDRHGPMVLAVCRRVLGNWHDAEDAFQATFLVLARKAGGTGWDESVGNWLYLVAYRLALRARAEAARRAAREKRMPARPALNPLADITVREAQAIFDEELARLPEKYRAPLVLCCLEGATRDEAARQLGWSLGTFKRRLEQGRTFLGKRLAGRGLTLPATLAATTLTATATVPSGLAAATIGTALRFTSGALAESGHAAFLAQGMLDGLKAARLKWAVLLVVVLGMVAAGVSFAVAKAWPGQAQEPPSEGLRQPAAKDKEPWPPKVEPLARTDADGEPLPKEAVARLGSGRMRHGVWCKNLAFSPDGKWIATGGNGRIFLWDSKTGKRLRRFDVNPDWIPALTFTKKGLVIAGSTLSKKLVGVQLVDPATGHKGELVEIKGVASPMPTLSADGTLLTLGDNNVAIISDAATGKEKLRLEVPGPFLLDMPFGPEGKTIAIGGASDLIRIHSTADGRVIRELKCKGVQLVNLVYSPDGQFLAALAYDQNKEPGEVIIWDLVSGREHLRLKGTSRYSTYVQFSPDGKHVATSYQYPDLILKDLATGKDVRRFPFEGMSYIRFSPDGKTMATFSMAGSIALWDTASGEVLPASADPYLDYVRDLRFRADDDRVFGSAAMRVAWDPVTGREMQRFPRVATDNGVFRYSLDESILAGPVEDGTIHLWIARTGHELCTLKVEKEALYDISFSPDGRRLCTLGESGTIRIWDAATGKELQKLASNKIWTHYLMACSPDGRWLASSMRIDNPRSSDYEVHIWDLKISREKSHFRVGGPGSLSYSPDGRLLAVVSPEGNRLDPQRSQVIVWDVLQNRRFRSLQGHKATYSSVAFAPDCRTLATGDGDGKVFLWELASGRERHQFEGHECLIQSLAFSRGGRLLAASSPDAPVYVWDITGLQHQPLSKLTADDVQRCWIDLADEDATRAHQAIWRLASSPRLAVPFLKEQLKTAVPIDGVRLARLIADLDSDQFAVREKAAGELEKLGDEAESSLTKALEGQPSAELRRQVEGLLEKLVNLVPARERLRTLRAVEVLENIGDTEARAVLKTLAQGAPEARLTREAQAALERLARRTALIP